MLRTVIEELKGIRLENKEFRDEVAAMRKENEYLRERLLVTERKLENVEDRMERTEKEIKRNNIVITGMNIEYVDGIKLKEDVHKFL
nr:unnamed protein product [Callosobruchus analis]